LPDFLVLGRTTAGHNQGLETVAIQISHQMTQANDSTAVTDSIFYIEDVFFCIIGHLIKMIGIWKSMAQVIRVESCS
jgi:hypothetical protein